MSYFSTFSNFAQIKMAKLTDTPPVKYRNVNVPLDLTQDSAVEISEIPFTLAHAEGALIKEVVPAKQLISAVSKFSYGSMTFRSYLSLTLGAFIESAIINGNVELRLFVPYAEVIPADKNEWNFWLADDDGYIGEPTAHSKDEDGGAEYRRSWQPGNAHVAPQQLTETIMDSAGKTVSVKHRMMAYSRALGNVAGGKATVEHLLVSATETADSACVNFWLGIDLTKGDVTVFKAST